ncbi:enolase C-terminal domain-like protein [Gryllotalpicola reticulitermitis]|uniref:Enolase C-terminal domain-like protein n=1 Tax=Gryllotalpicola reticulitermitis TaxID=1184153 RepID=A0ABV8Q9R5_9MICO
MVASAAIDRIETNVYRVPTDLPEADGTAEWAETTIVVATVAAGSTEGLGYSYCEAGAADVIEHMLAPLVRGRRPEELPAIRAVLEHKVRNTGRDGLVACALSAMDVALWDLRARLLDVPLLALLGRASPSARAYGSGGFTTYDDSTMAQQLRGWVAAGMTAAKIKIGESRGGAESRDLHRVRLAREAIGPSVELFVDANGGYTPSQARRMERALQEFGVRWFEEPVSSDMPEELADIRSSSRMDIAAGEYCWRVQDAARLLEARAVDCLQLDVTRCGGFTGWLQGAAVAAAHGVEISAHCAPQLSAHAVCASPNARHLEYFHDHARIEPLLFDGTLHVRSGALVPHDLPGHGLSVSDRAEEFRT